jgi:hypothetical protein
MYGWFYLQYIEQNISYVQYVTIATQQLHWYIDVSRMDITMDITICMQASYFMVIEVTFELITCDSHSQEFHAVFICTFLLDV